MYIGLIYERVLIRRARIELIGKQNSKRQLEPLRWQKGRVKLRAIS